VLFAFVVLRYMTDRPRDAAWLSAQERAWLEAELLAERLQVENRGPIGLWQALMDRRVIVLSLIYFTSVTSGYGIVFFLPQIVKALGQSNFMTGVLAAIPHAIGVIGLLCWGYSSDRRNERRRHLIAAACVAALGFTATAWLRESYWGIAAMSVATIGLYGSRPAFWPMPSQFLTGAAAAAGIALINSIGNLGGYVGPMIVGWIKDRTQSFEMGLYFLAASALASAAIAYFALPKRDGAPSAP
jgi:MFS transporter, ACS family, tartrate transporter